MTVHSHCVESFENILQQYVGEGWVAEDNEKTHFFPEHPVLQLLIVQIFVMNNYFGLGLDADLCLDFHNARYCDRIDG